MKTISISDEAWEYLKHIQVELSKGGVKVQSLGEIASTGILSGVKP